MNELEKIANKAVMAHKNGNLKQARKLYEEILSNNPDYLPALQGLGLLLLHAGENDKAVTVFERLIHNDPQNAGALYNLARLYQMGGRLSDARPLYEQLVKLKPDFGHGWNNLGIILREMGETWLAIDALKKAASLLPNSPFPLNNLAVALEEAGKLDEAEKYYQSALKLDKDYYSARFNLGCLFFRLERFEKARKHLAWIIKHNSNDPTASFLLRCIDQKTAPSRAPVEYVKKTFDHCAAVFEETLVKGLSYSTFRSLFYFSEPYLKKGSTILDLGCGTGLGADLYRPYAQKLHGIDCSNRMLELAEKKGVFDKLFQCDILEPWPTETCYDFIYSSDCMCYFGKLTPVFQKVKDHLIKGGLISFSIETGANVTDGFHLSKSGRFIHTINYVSQTLENLNFKILDSKETVLRMEKGSPVKGTLIIARTI